MTLHHAALQKCQEGQSPSIDTVHEVTADTFLVTGGAGFIGSHTAEALLRQGHQVVVIDEMNDYYSLEQKEHNLQVLRDAVRYSGQFRFYQGDISDRPWMLEVFQREPSIRYIIHLAARAGVRPSIENPEMYVQSNVMGTTILLELAKQFRIQHVMYASSSSVYGLAEGIPYAETLRTDDPVSPYAATKKACEAMAACYASLYRMHVTGFRFFTVYGPRGRPDMAPFKFIDRVARGLAIDQYGNGDTSRDYTYIDDIVDGILKSVDRAQRQPTIFHSVYNLGNAHPVLLRDMIQTVEKVVGRQAVIKYLPDQKGDVPCTFADVSKAHREMGYQPKVSLEEGLSRFYTWWKSFYGNNMSESKLLA